jgi:hypothetical protein
MAFGNDNIDLQQVSLEFCIRVVEFLRQGSDSDPFILEHLISLNKFKSSFLRMLVLNEWSNFLLLDR